MFVMLRPGACLNFGMDGVEGKSNPNPNLPLQREKKGVLGSIFPGEIVPLDGQVPMLITETLEKDRNQNCEPSCIPGVIILQ